MGCNNNGTYKLPNWLGYLRDQQLAILAGVWKNISKDCVGFSVPEGHLANTLTP